MTKDYVKRRKNRDIRPKNFYDQTDKKWKKRDPQRKIGDFKK